jgi:hypothetical protein
VDGLGDGNGEGLGLPLTDRGWRDLQQQHAAAEVASKRGQERCKKTSDMNGVLDG